MKSYILLTLLTLFPVATFAAGPAIELMSPDIDIQDKESLRNGFKLYIDHCAACHAARFMRYERVQQDLEVSEDMIKELMRFGAAKKSDSIHALIGPEMGDKLFGIAPPDLTLEAKYRGADWLYTYLMTFYKDEKTPFGYNNKVMKNVAMPWVLSFEQETMSKEEFAKTIADLTNYMVYMAEPIKPFRESFGKYVLIFLVILLIPVWFLKKEYWKDVH